jgi:hypothetical protein
MSPAGSVTSTGSANRPEQQAQAVALAPALGFGGAQAAHVVLDLLRGPPQVGDVAQHRNDAAFARAGRGGLGHELEEQVAALGRIDQGQLARSGERPGARQRGGEEQVVERHGAPPPFAALVVDGEQALGRRIGDQDAAVGIGEQHGDPTPPTRCCQALVLAQQLVALVADLLEPQRVHAVGEQPGRPAHRLGQSGAARRLDHQDTRADPRHWPRGRRARGRATRRSCACRRRRPRARRRRGARRRAR